MHGNNWSTSAGPARGFPGHRFYFGDSRDQNPNSVKRLLTLLLGCLPGFSGPQLSQKDSAVILDSGSLFDGVYSPFTPRNSESAQSGTDRNGVGMGKVCARPVWPVCPACLSPSDCRDSDMYNPTSHPHSSFPSCSQLGVIERRGRLGSCRPGPRSSTETAESWRRHQRDICWRTDRRTDRWRMTPCVRNVTGRRRGWVLLSFRRAAHIQAL